MKNWLKLTSGMALGLTITIAACQKDKTGTAVETPKEKVSLTDLWEKMNLPSDPSGDAATLAIYASLNEKELEEYFAIRLQKDSLQLAKKIAADNNGRVSAAQEVTIGLQLRKTKQGLTQLQEEAATKFNKQINQLSKEETKEIVALHQAKKGDVSAMACPLVSFPGTASVKWARGIRHYGYYEIGNYPGPDCDWEFRFDGIYWRIYGENASTRYLLDSYNGVISRREIYYSNGYDTGVLFGFWNTLLLIGGPGNVSIEGLN
ncbi:hypothetical protein [Chitinophaga niabensis]|uniref:Lipoprotein n=1 Tax=Chitinophaga niabensis TaxID=536979 RepID=A0A1N6K1Y0_9BACT|nr:hypothetical protein [Chitinophaga niabensis]SIO50588.1 hypothetical protein SAMN04488055_4923 [Chitinophaga niabensis]